jgi:hypothetical protein
MGQTFSSSRIRGEMGEAATSHRSLIWRVLYSRPAPWKASGPSGALELPVVVGIEVPPRQPVSYQETALYVLGAAPGEGSVLAFELPNFVGG